MVKDTVPKEIALAELNAKQFIDDKVGEIRSAVGGDRAIVALSGGVDSSVVTMLGRMALEDRLPAYFIDNGLMRQDEPENVVDIFKRLRVDVVIVDAREKFFAALRGKRSPSKKREAITQVFYKDVFSDLVRESGAKHLLQGTILTDVEETVAGVKRQHNVLSQMGINTEEEFGYTVLEPLVQLRKPGVRKVAQALKLPLSIYSRMPFPGPALAARIIGAVTPDKVALVRQATEIVEYEFVGVGAFQYSAILHNDRVTGVRDGHRKLGYQVEVRCFDSPDARTATPTQLPYATLKRLANRITSEVPGVVSVTYNIASKPPSTIEPI